MDYKKIVEQLEKISVTPNASPWFTCAEAAVAIKLLLRERAKLLKKMNDVIETVDAQPVVHAKWEKIDYNMFRSYGCSNCKKECIKGIYGYDIFCEYCPNCGAKMDGE